MRHFCASFVCSGDLLLHSYDDVLWEPLSLNEKGCSPALVFEDVGGLRLAGGDVRTDRRGCCARDEGGEEGGKTFFFPFF